MAYVHVGKGPIDVAVNPSSGLVYVTNIESGTVSIIDSITNTVSSTIKVGNIPYAIAVNPATNMTYFTDIGDGVYLYYKIQRTIATVVITIMWPEH